jgi:glycosyltransferase involved in cell wall biosynthesis
VKSNGQRTTDNGQLASVIVPTYNRQNQILRTVSALRKQNLSENDYEIIVVDDGSNPPVEIEGVKVLRLENVERSAARNAGVEQARGEIIIFIDDDMMVTENFVESHTKAHREWSDAIAIGKISLPDDFIKTPFGRFRYSLELTGTPTMRGIVDSKNFCAAGNMSIKRERFLYLGGFDRNLNSGEDQDLAIRHTSQNGKIVFLPEAESIHLDTALDIRSYCRRSEWGNEFVKKFCDKHPDLPDNIAREKANGFIQLRSESLKLSVGKVIKSFFGLKPITGLMFFLVSLLERFAPNSYLLVRFYHLLLGTHIFRGFRRALRKSSNAN